MTTTPITEQQLADIDARQKAATKGPWTLSENYSDVLGPDGDQLASYWNPTSETRNGEFIANAPEDVRTLLAEVRRLREAMDQIRHLHKDSPMGPCPVCIDADADRRGEDPTIPYPCPTARLAGAQDCDPPSAPPAEACGKCRQPFDPADTRFDGRARYYLTAYCRSCVDRCTDTEIADHRCVICA